jgi:histidine kinase
MLGTPQLLGYELTEVIHTGTNTIIYRGIWRQKQQPVIIKILNSDYPSLEVIARLKHEYSIAANLEHDNIVKVISLVTHDKQPGLVFEDCGYISLKQYLEYHKPSLELALQIVISLTKALAYIHSQHIIHKNIKPANIVIHPHNAQVKLTDFSIASRLEKETPQLLNPKQLEGTLAYMSPEQTGRMNRTLDFRSDFYSLGVTFYEILTRQLPFASSDPLELVYCHIAKKPTPVQQLNPQLPSAIASIIAKLMAKNAEERYQSAKGLKLDLEDCLVQLKTTGTIIDIIPGERERAEQLLIPQKLYGREKEVGKLLTSFDRVSQGLSEIMLVSGYSGIGKSSLVNEVHKLILRQRGFFISGKFDQFQRNIPYAALLQAFQSLIQQLLTLDALELQAWQNKLLAALGNNGQLIIDVIPELELIIGQQPEVPHLAATESQNRFNRVFQKFLHVFTQKEHPLVIFLDDLQWADAASLKLIKLFITDPESEYLLFIGAYRDNEVSPTHPLMEALNAIEKTGININKLLLKPLHLTHIQQLLNDTFGTIEVERIQQLANWLYNKTTGNPFFLTQLLKTLHQEQLFTYDFVRGSWLWDIQQIQAVESVNLGVVELLARNICNLPTATIEILKLAACIGARFRLDVLANIVSKTIAEVTQDLWVALQQEFILPLTPDYKIPLLFEDSEIKLLQFDDSRLEYRFLHDKVQQAAYSLISESEKQVIHLKIGQLILQKISSEELADNILDIVNHLNFCTNLLTSQTERNELIGLNFMAAKKAKASNAYKAAQGYLNVSLSLLTQDCWQSKYEFMLEMYALAVEVEYLNTNYERSHQLADLVLNHVENILDKVRIYEFKILSYISQNQMKQAVELGLQVLKQLGVHLIQALPTQSNVAELVNLRTIEDPNQIAALRILIAIASAVYLATPEIYSQVAFTMTHICNRYGISALASYAYATCSLICEVIGEIDLGYQYGQLSLRILEKFNAIEYRSKVVMIYNACVRHWKEHSRETLAPLQEAAISGIETGDIEYACYSAMYLCIYSFFAGEELDSVNQKYQHYLDIMLKFQQNYQIHYTRVWQRLVLSLKNISIETAEAVDKIFNEEQLIFILKEANNIASLFGIYFSKLLLHFLFKNYTQAVGCAQLADKYAIGVGSLMMITQHKFYYSLALLGEYSKVPSCQQKEYLQQVETNQHQMRIWANNAPTNYQHKYDLVEAEKARVLGQYWEAAQLYEKAIKNASQNNYLHEEALAYELAAEFYLSHGMDKIPQIYITEAHYRYIRWGATAKVKDLGKRYSYLLVCTQEKKFIDAALTTSSTLKNSCFLDVSTVMKASQALSIEIVPNRLLDKLMHLAKENAGAQKILFITNNNHELVIESSLIDEENMTSITQNLSVNNSHLLPVSLIRYVERTCQHLVLDDATKATTFNSDLYIIQNQPVSILVLPIIYTGKLMGILYLENNLTKGAFSSDRLEILQVLCTQAAISLENAYLYSNLEKKVAERTEKLQTALEQLQKTQLQLIQTEKMSSLGQLVAGVAHEINNPTSFIYGNLNHAHSYTQDLLDLLQLYQKHYPQPTKEIQDKAETIDLEFLTADLPKLLASMKIGAERIKNIVTSLRTFSRMDEAEYKEVDIHEGIDSTLMILEHRLKPQHNRSTIKVIKQYGNLPKVSCYGGKLNQVFMNLLVNAIDALDEAATHKKDTDLQIRISTEILDDKQVVIGIADNGLGVPIEVQKRLFDPFFTTKPVGKGMGLGLSMSYQIITENHGGTLEYVSLPGQGAEFIIRIPLKRV